MEKLSVEILVRAKIVGYTGICTKKVSKIQRILPFKKENVNCQISFLLEIVKNESVCSCQAVSTPFKPYFPLKFDTYRLSMNFIIICFELFIIVL